MLKNYLTIAYRNILNNKLFSAINILGLAIGLACCTLIVLFVADELSYDKHYPDSQRTYRVAREFYGNNLQLATVAPPIGPLLQQDFPEIEDTTRLLHAFPASVAYGDRLFRESKFTLADPNVFEFFDLEFVRGDAASALAGPVDIVLTERAAERYFGNDDPIGKQLFLMNQANVQVTGVIKDLPTNTHMTFEVIGNIAAIALLQGPEALENWGSNNYFTYIRLPEGFDPDVLEAKFPDFLIKHLRENAPDWTRLWLQPLTDIHLRSDLDQEWKPNGSMATVYTFSAIAVVVLLIACINFMNLTTARSTQRAKEVGMRKVVGAARSQIIIQFLGESIVLTALAMVLALGIVELTLPAFAAFVEKPLTASILFGPGALAILLGSVMVVGAIAGSYPALYLSSFRPAAVLKGDSGGTGSALLRQCLVVFQFAVSIGLIVATGVVIAQMQYAKNMDLGYEKERNLVSALPFFADLWGIYEPMKVELEAHPDIVSVTLSSRVPTQQNLDGSGYQPLGEDQVIDPEQSVALSDIKADYNWFDHYGIELVAGRFFRDAENERRPTPPTHEEPIKEGVAILNETAARRFGWSPQAALGKVLRTPASADLTTFIDRVIVGVIKDFHFASLHDEIKATIYSAMHPRYGRRISVKLAPGNPRDAIDHFESVWNKVLPGEPVSWEFLDDRFDALYRGEERQAQIFGAFSALAIFVATLGLFGLASFTTERRTKEIGIRKVMGANVRDIVLLLTSDFTKLVLIANVFAWPAAYLLMNQWLGRFVYSAPISIWLFLGAGVLALVLAWVTVAAHATRAATARPVLALRYE